MKKLNAQGPEEGGKGGGGGAKPGSWRRFLVTLLVIAVLALAGGVLAVRTESGKNYVRKRMQERVGLDLTLGEARIGWPYALVLEDVASVGFDRGPGPGFRAQEIRIAPGVRTRWKVAVRGLTLRLVRGKGNAWYPEYFRGIADLASADLAKLSKATAAFRERVGLEIGDSLIEWLDEKGKVIAGGHGIRFEVRPVAIPHQEMYYHLLHVYSFEKPDGTHLYDMQREWLASHKQDYLELLSAGRETEGIDE